MKAPDLNQILETVRLEISTHLAVPVDSLVILHRPHRSYIINKITGRCVYRTGKN